MYESKINSHKNLKEIQDASYYPDLKQLQKT